MRGFGNTESRRISQHKLIGILVSGCALEFSRAIVQPDNHITGVDEVRPDQVIVPVLVYILDKKRAPVTGPGVKVNDNARRLAEPDLDALITARSGKRRLIRAIVAIKVGNCQ